MTAKILLPLEQSPGAVRLGGLMPREPQRTLLDVLERAAPRVRAEPGALGTALYNELALLGWESARIAEALQFGQTPWLRLVKGIPPPRNIGLPSMRHRSRVLGARVLSRGDLCSWSDDGIVICWDLQSAEI